MPKTIEVRVSWSRYNLHKVLKVLIFSMKLYILPEFAPIPTKQWLQVEVGNVRSNVFSVMSHIQP